MKIAIFEPDPRVCGPLSWAGHLQTGFRALGHQCDIVSATKSGRKPAHWGNVKTGGKWWATAPDVITKMAELYKTLHDYDFIILPEPKSPLADKLSMKAAKNDGGPMEVPWYVVQLIWSQKPFTTALHGNSYAEKGAPFARTLFNAANFTGKLIVHSKDSWTSDPLIQSIPGVELVLPYAPRNDIDAGFPRMKTVGCTGRFMFNKGSHIVGLAGQHLDPDTTVEIWGSCSVGRGPNLTFNLYEVIKPMAVPGQYIRHHNSDPNHPKANEDGNIVQPFLYDVRIKDHALVRYLGNYVDPVGTCARLGVHVDLTAKKYSGGLVEFVTLEAMDAGSVCITPPHVSDPANFRTLVLDWFVNPPGSVTSAVKDPDTTLRVATAIKQALSFQDQPYEVHRDLVRHNRESVRRVNDPKVIAERVLEECR